MSVEGRARWAGRGLFAGIAALLVLDAVWIARYHEALRPMTPGDVAPDFSLPTIDREGRSTGEVVTLSSFRGRVVVLDFWAAWCGPCREAMPLLEEVYRAHRDHGLVLLSIKTDGDELGAARPVLERTSFPIVLDDHSVSARYRVTNLPHVVVVDRRGVVRFVHRGRSGGTELERQVATLLGESVAVEEEGGAATHSDPPHR